ncbi:ribosome biogenesis factor YjgA [Desulfobacterota bacterium M19]
MEQISRSEKKRRAKGFEQLTLELIQLRGAEISALPVDDFLKKDIKDAAGLKAGARKRQIKYISKQLRTMNSAPLLAFLAERKGSRLQQTQAFHRLEHWRDEIISAAIQAQRDARQEDRLIDDDWSARLLDDLEEELPGLNRQAVSKAAIRYALNRKPSHQREIFRLLKAAFENRKYVSTP